MIPRRVAAVLLLVLTACSDSAGPGLDGNATSLADLERRLDVLRDQLKIPGLGVGISEGNAIVWTKGLGLSGVAQNKAPTSTTGFHIASLTKGFAGIILVQLVSEGRVSLDDPVTKYGVSISGDAGITVRHLANMTSQGTPGRTFLYSGDRFDLLGQVMQSATGKSFATLAMERIITPLGLTRTAPNVDNPAFNVSGLNRDAFLANLAAGYSVSGSSFNRINYPTNFGPAAGLISTIDDLLNFSMAIDSDRLITPAERSMLFEPAAGSSGTLPYAIGWFSQTIRGKQIQWAYGYWTGNSSLIIRVPSMGRTFVALANSDGLSADFTLGSGNLESSPVAREFLNAFVFGSTPLR